MKFDLAPYNDTYSKLDNYYKVLFKAGYNVQARELNEIQSILQNQVASLGDHLFKNGSIISGCSSSFVKYDYINIEDNNFTILSGMKLIGNSGVEAIITNVDNNFINVMYTKTGNSGVKSTFDPLETISLYDDSLLIGELSVSQNGLKPSIGKSLLFTINDGIFYYNGYFIKLHSHSIITEKYITTNSDGVMSSELTYKVGLDVVEEIITVDEDPSLYDPHFESNNFGAPGADRFKISLNLSIKEYSDTNSYNFILLAKVKQNGVIEYLKKDTEYATIMKELARRLYETYGDFNIIPWKSYFLNEKKNNIIDNEGWSITGNENNYTAVISPGLGYVKGYRIETIVDTTVSTNKPRSTNIINNYGQPLEQIQHIMISVDNINWLNTGDDSVISNETFKLYDTNNALIGDFKVLDIAPVTDNVFKIYVQDLSVNSGKVISAAKSIKNESNTFNGSIYGNNVLNGIKKDRLFFIGKNYVKSVNNLKVSSRDKFVGTLDSNGSITFTTEFEFVNAGYGWLTSDNFQVTQSKVSISSDKKSITINLGAAKASQEILYVSSIVKTLTRKTKTKTRHVISQGSAPVENTSTHINLAHSDSFILESVILTDTTGLNQKNITDEYELYTNQSDNGYGLSYIKRKFYRDFNESDRLIISYYYNEHGTTGDYFDVLSYDCKYEEINSYNGYNLSDYLDFRSSNVFIDLNSAFNFDVEYYLPRNDLLMVNIDGEFYIKQGIPSENPVIPYEDEDALVIAEVYIDPYCANKNNIKVKNINNKAYKATDITKIQKRIDNLEYSISLSLLEQNTINMSVKDQNGLDRYKNGYLIDNFKGYYAADVMNDEFRAALDRENGILRPQFDQNNVKLEFKENKSSNIKLFGKVAMSNFSHDLFITNPYATQSLSINPYLIFRKTGNVTLSPNIDTWAESNYLPTVVVNIDTGVGAYQELANSLKLNTTEFGAWIDYNKTTVVDKTVTNSQDSINNYVTTNTVTTTTTDSSRTIATTGVTSNMSTFSVDNAVKDVSIIPMIRSTTVQFYSTNMKPNTRLYAYFDGIDVTSHCKGFQQLDSNGDVLVNRSLAVFGAYPLITDSDGNLSGEFRIPADTFFTGEKTFVLTNDPDNSGNPDIETTRSETTYFAAGVSATKQSYNMNVITPDFGTTISTEYATRTTVSRNQTVSATMRPEVAARLSRDPIAQAFKVDRACFISKVGVYFENVDSNSDVIWFEIREMVNGYPVDDFISRKEVKAAEIYKYISTDASIEYQAEFTYPVYVDPTKSYAFVIGGYSPDTKVYISRLGSTIIGGNSILEMPPLQYTMFRSLNGETWNAQQLDTLKLNIYRCVFDTSESIISMVNESSLNYINTDVDPIELQRNSNRVRIYAKNHGLRVNDRLVLDFNKDVYYRLEVTTGMPQIGQPISTLSGSAIVKDILITSTLNVYDISFEKMIGVFANNQEFTCETREVTYRDLFLINDKGAYDTPIIQNQSNGYIRGKSNEANALNSIAGADLELFSKEHIVREVDSIDSFIIEIESKFTSQGRFGGDNVSLFGANIQYNMINIAGQYMSYGLNDKWSIQGYNLEGKADKEYVILPSHNVDLENTNILFSDNNEYRVIGKSNDSITLTIKLNSNDPYLSQVINLDSFSATLITNRIETLDSTVYSKLPIGPARYITETDGSKGVEGYKYVSNRVLLENPAVDIKLIIAAHCPNVSDFDLYVKLISINDVSKDDKTIQWRKVDSYNKKYTTIDKNDYIEYNLLLSSNMTTYTDNTEFIAYRIKIVGRSNNKCRPPLFKELRAIAIT